MRANLSTVLTLIFFLCCPNAWAAWALDQGWATNAVGGTGVTVTFTFAGAVASEAGLICGTAYENAVTVTGVVDTVNISGWTHLTDTGIPVDGVGGAVGKHLDVWAFPNSAAGTPVVTLTYSGVAQTRSLTCGSYTGLATSSFFDVGHGNAQEDPGTGTDAVTSGATASTTQANDLAVAMTIIGASNTVTAGTGWTSRFSGDSGSNWAFGVEDKNVTTTTTATGTFTINNASSDPMTFTVTLKQPTSGVVCKGALSMLGVGGC